MPIRWAVWFATQGDCRFLSHHDMMRLMERAATRAGLPLKYTQGFNPHPRLSLGLPKPVGVGSTCEILVMEFDEPPADASWPEQLSRQLPAGMRVLKAEETAGRSVQIESVTYEFPLEESESPLVRQRVEQLQGLEKWEVRHGTFEQGQPVERTVITDIKPRLSELAAEAGTLHFTLRGGQESARPVEVLELVGFSRPGDACPALSPVSHVLARLVRTGMQIACH